MSEAVLTNGGSLPLAAISIDDYDSFAGKVIAAVQQGATVIACFADSQEQSGGAEIIAVLGHEDGKRFSVHRTRTGRVFPSLAPDCPQFHMFEREMAEQYGLIPEGHPWLKPVRFHAAWSGRDAWNRDPAAHPVPGDMEFFRVEGEEIHEVGVGPVHAGVIEPGHFRFQCFGEKVLHLEISLGYQHRGIERSLIGGPFPKTNYQVETLAGDTSIGHMAAYSMVIEALAGMRVAGQARQVGELALELERLANHVGDIGALAGDVGFLPTASFCGRLRGDYLNLTATICGNRFGRGLVRPGGVLFSLKDLPVERMKDDLAKAASHTRGALDLFFEASSVLARLEGCGVVTRDDAVALGLVGPAARACGIDCDARLHFPINDAPVQWPVIIEEGGDVMARATVRRREIEESLKVVEEQLAAIAEGHDMPQPVRQLLPEHFAIGVVEGWRGRIAHVAVTDDKGCFRRYKVVDPSFFNWSGLAMALRDEQISDFPLCNKSFNLSYCGFDL